MWKSQGRHDCSVTDSSGDPFVEVTHFTASDGTEMSVWTAPVITGGSTPTPLPPSHLPPATWPSSPWSTPGCPRWPTSPRSTRCRTPSGPPRRRPRSSRPPRRPPRRADELAVGFYADSGFGDSLAGGSGYTVRANVSPASDMEMLAEDQPYRSGCHACGQRPDRCQDHLADGHRRLRVVDPERAAGTDRRSSASPGNGSANRQLDRAAQRGQPDHELHRHSVRRRHRAADDGRDRQPARHDRGGAGADQRHDLHLHRHRDQRHRHQPAVGAERPDHAQLRSRRASGARCRPSRWWPSAPS